MNAIGPVVLAAPEDAHPHLWGQEHRMIRGELWNELFVWGHRRGMSDVHLQTNHRVMIDVDGRFYPATERAITAEEMNSAVTLLYGVTGPAHLKKAESFDLAHVVEPERGERYSLGGRPEQEIATRRERYRFRVNGTSILTDGADGAQVTLRAVENDPPRLECMAIEPGILRAYRPHNGIVLICGATGTGKTRLQAGMTRSLIEAPHFHGKIIEVAAPIEYEFDRVQGASSMYSPSEIGRHVKSAAAAMRDALRRKPKVIVSPECRDRETMEVAIEGSQTGHAVYSTVHTSSVVETVQRILAMFPQGERADRAVSLMQSLRLIINCALVFSLDGRRTQLREYLAFGAEERRLFLDTPVIAWPRLTETLLAERGQTYAVAVRRALEAGLIAGDVAREWMEAA